jgi:alkylation response protein AidB-like acyl-CoA dehydrogenase
LTDLLRQLEPGHMPAHAESLRAQVRAFLHATMPDLPAEVRARSWLGSDIEFSRSLARHGWVGVTLPRAYGGAEMDVFSRYVLVEELLCAGAPVSAHWIADRQSGPLLMRYGTPQQRAFFLPRICRGEAFFCIGMSEPGAGSDLAAVTTRATRTDDGWLLQGQKLWTTNAPHCDYMIALVRTSGDAADRHHNLSQVIVDLKLPGVTIRPIRDLAGDAHFSEVFFDQVRLGPEALVGQEGQGWEQVTAELALERSGPERIYSSMVLLETWAQGLKRQARNLADTRTLGRMVSHLAALRAMSLAVTAQIAKGGSPVVEAALVKDLGTAFEQAIPAWISESLDADACDESLLRVLAYVQQMAPSFSLRGGTREILRSMIARGLGLR